MRSDSYFSLKFEDGRLVYIDQTGLPVFERFITTEDYKQVATSIKRLEIRGAPLIGVAAAYALAMSQKYGYSEESFTKAYKTLAATRPTAVNLFNALDRIMKLHDELPVAERKYEVFLDEAIAIHREDEEMCEAIALNWSKVFKKNSVVLTHCNTGKLATGGIGTAFGLIRRGFEAGKVAFIYADETRPLFQGLRLTSYELDKIGAPFKVITESTAGVLIRDGKIDLVITGADRIAANGDSANKLGTFTLSVLCKTYGVPFYIAAPSTTIDTSASGFSDIPIEERAPEELTRYLSAELAAIHLDSFNPSFDVTPAENITGIITEKGIFSYPYNFN